MKTKKSNKLIAEFMGFQKPTVGSKWNYDRSLDSSRNTQDLEVVKIEDGMVSFKEKMGHTSYGIKYFDGKTFFPSGTGGWVDDHHHYPVNNYHESWEMLMPVVEKIERLLINNRKPWITIKSFEFGRDDETYSEVLIKLKDEDFEKNNYQYEYEGDWEASKIIATHKAVTEFIKWYNKNKQ